LLRLSLEHRFHLMQLELCSCIDALLEHSDPALWDKGLVGSYTMLLGAFSLRPQLAVLTVVALLLPPYAASTSDNPPPCRKLGLLR